MMTKMMAFIKKDFLIQSSYKCAFLFTFIALIHTLLIYFFINRLFGASIPGALEEFGISYFSYVLVSMAFFNYLGIGIGGLRSRLSSEQIEGTLESLLMTPTSMYSILIGMCAWNILFATIDVVLHAVVGVYFFGIDFSSINILSTMVLMFLTIVCFASLGIISASCLIVFKGDPLTWVITGFEGLVGGIYFPVTLMPGWLQTIAQFLPITHAIRALQLAIYRGYSLTALRKECLILAVFTGVLFPLSLVVWTTALTRARRRGTLMLS